MKNAFTIIILIIIALVVATFVVSQTQLSQRWVKGSHGGNKCYTIQKMPKSIRYPVYFLSEADCTATLKIK